MHKFKIFVLEEFLKKSGVPDFSGKLGALFQPESPENGLCLLSFPFIIFKFICCHYCLVFSVYRNLFVSFVLMNYNQN